MSGPPRRPRLALPFTILSGADAVRLVAGEDFRYTLTGTGLDSWLPGWLAGLDGEVPLEQALGWLPEARQEPARQLVDRLYGERVLIDGTAPDAHAPVRYRLAPEGSAAWAAGWQSAAADATVRALPTLCQDRLDFDEALRFNRHCRETRAASWLKSLLEAVQGRHYVRYLKEKLHRQGGHLGTPASFGDHALYYSVYPDRLCDTVLGRPTRLDSNTDVGRTEDVATLAERLGPDRPVLFRNLTPPGIAMERLGWCVLRVLVPGLQPLHGHHALPFLGGPLWAPLRWKDWTDMPPHPFP